MNPVQACKDCKGLFAFLPRGLCTECIDRREEQYQAVREFLLENPGAPILSAATATGVGERLISGFIREGRLRFADPGDATLQEQAAREALRARLADEVAAQVAQTAATSAPRPPAGRGMRIRPS